MSQYGFYFDMTHCVGCKTCQVACKDVNDLPVGVVYRHADSYETGTFPLVGAFNYSGACNHCAMPACMANCTTGAIIKNEDDGIVYIDEELCIGCGTCEVSCPYGVPKLRTDRNVYGKCDGCMTLRKKGEEPACVTSCPARALDFGDLEELEAKYGSGLVNEFPLIGSADVTTPSIRIRLMECADTSDYRPSMR